MKLYIKPSFESVELRPEERLAGSIVCPSTGSCHNYVAAATQGR